ncbi:AsmA family protein [Ferrigenium sp. UT5]|uniref:AsmA family protein n=1 Tax=Ferrigenium sp. UT5 TaxID=3242105 RepID=UPI00354DF811
MDKKTIFIKTSKGESEVSSMSGDMKRVLLLIDGNSSLDNVIKRAPPSLRGDIPEIIQRLLDGELIVDKAKANAGLKIVSPKIIAPKTEQAGEELDFTSMFRAPSQAAMAAEAAKQSAGADAQEAIKRKEAEAARLKAEAEVRAIAEAKRQAEEAARAKAEADALAKREAAVRQAAEDRARAEAELRQKAEQEAARIKAEMQAAAKAQHEAEERAKREAEAARIKAEQEAARIKAELEAAARARREAEEKAQREAEAAARARAEAEAARLKAEQEAARIKAELEAAKARAEAEARALAEERARIEAEERRRHEEAEAARIKAEEEAAARAKAEAEERQRREEAEAARIKAEEEAAARAKAEAEERQRREEAEAARIKAEEEAAARAKAEAEERQRREEAEAARIKAEEEAAARAKAEAEECQRREEAEAARIKAEEEAAARAKAEAEERQSREEAEAARIKAEEEQKRQEAATSSAAASPFKIDLDALKEVESAPVMVQQAERISSAVPDRTAEPVPEIKIEAKKEETRQADIAAEMARQKAEQEAKQKAEQLQMEREAQERVESQRLAAEQAAAWAEAERRATQQSKLESEQAALQTLLAQAKENQMSSAPRRRKPVSLGKLMAAIIGFAVVLVWTLPMFWPMEEYIGPVEQQLSTRLGQPVKIGDLKGSLLPWPKVEITQMTIGAQQELSVASAILSVNPFSLFSNDWIIDKAELDGITVEGDQLEPLFGWLRGLNGQSGFSMRSFNLRDVQIKTAPNNLPLLQGVASFDEGEFARLALHDATDKLHLDFRPLPGRLHVEFRIKESALPFLPQVVFGDFKANGEIGAEGMVLSELDVYAYGGIGSGSGKLDWHKGWRLEVTWDAKTMELAQIFPQYGLAGELFANGVATARSQTLSGLADAVRLDANFEIKRGVINGIDIVETARLLSREHLPGGRTHFDQLTGSALLENHVLRLRQLKISSGMLNASGAIDVAEGGQLSGSLNSEIKMRAGNNPLVLSGTLQEPRLQAR